MHEPCECSPHLLALTTKPTSINPIPSPSWPLSSGDRCASLLWPLPSSFVNKPSLLFFCSFSTLFFALYTFDHVCLSFLQLWVALLWLWWPYKWTQTWVTSHWTFKTTLFRASEWSTGANFNWPLRTVTQKSACACRSSQRLELTIFILWIAFCDVYLRVYWRRSSCVPFWKLGS